MAITDKIEDLEYEVDEKGQPVLVRSISSTEPVYLRFTNKTKKHVLIWWRNFEGKRHLYAMIDPGDCYDVATFMTHPWGFSDAVTRERYVVSNKKIFRPPRGKVSSKFRTNWNITIGVRTLKLISIYAVAELLKVPKAVDEAELPQCLVRDVKRAVWFLNKRPLITPVPEPGAVPRPQQVD